MLDEFGSTAFYAGDFQNGFQACNMLMNKLGMIPEEHHKRIRDNHQAYKAQLEGMIAQNEAIIQQRKEQEKAEKKAQKEIKVNTPKKSTKTGPRKGFKEKKKR